MVAVDRVSKKGLSAESSETKWSWCGFKCLLGSTVKRYWEMKTKERVSEREYIYLRIAF